MRKKYSKFFFAISIAILSVTSIAKLISLLGRAPILSNEDPVLLIPNRMLIATSCLLEIVAIFACFFLRDQKSKAIILSFLGAVFLVYRFSFFYGGFSQGCPCLGTLGSALPISNHLQNLALFFSADWLLLGGVVAFFCVAPNSNGK